MDQNKLRGSLSDEDLAALHQRNEERAQQVKQRMGRRWCCHPDNKVEKVEQQSVLHGWKR